MRQFSDEGLAAHDAKVRAETLRDLANDEADWTARAWRPQEAETVVKMRKAILARAARIERDAGVGDDHA